MITTRQQLLPVALEPLPIQLQQFGAVWPNTLTEIDIDHAVGCGLVKRQAVEFVGIYRWLLLPGMHVRKYLPSGDSFSRPPVFQKASEMACLADVAALSPEKYEIDRRRRGLKISSTGRIVMIRVVRPTLWTLRRNMVELLGNGHRYRTVIDSVNSRPTTSKLKDGKSMTLYVPASVHSDLCREAQRAGLYEHEQLEIRGYTADTWPPGKV